MITENKTYPDLCICGGAPVPEGRMVCFSCEAENNRAAPRNPAKAVKKAKIIVSFTKDNRND